MEGFCEEHWQKMWAKRELEREEDVLKAEIRRRRGEWGIEAGSPAFGQNVN